MSVDQDKLSQIFNDLSKSLEKDKHTEVFFPSDVRLLSYVDHGIPTKQPMFDLCIGKDGVPIGKIIEFYGFEGVGKSLKYNSDILTPKGNIKISDIKINDEIIGSDGKKQFVTGVYPQGKLQLYNVIFEDGRSVECSEEHLWEVYFPSEHRRDKSGWSVKSLKEILSLLNKSKNYSLYIRTISPVYKEQKEYYIDPYILGCLLGDGGFTTNCITFTNTDPNIINEFKNRLKSNYTLKIHTGNNIQYILKKPDNELNNKYISELRRMNLWKKYSFEKFIPLEYFEGSIEQRWSLLQGLMDTDGSNMKCFSRFNTGSLSLAKDVQKLVWSLGGICEIKSKKRENRKIEYYQTIKFSDTSKTFKTPLKLNKIKSRNRPIEFKLKIKSIKKTSIDEAICIRVSNKDKLFVTNDFLLTHNTTAAYHLISECQKKGGAALFIDTEQSFDLTRAQECGVKEENLFIASATTIDSVFRTIINTLDSLEENKYSRDFMIVVDSITGVSTEFDKDKEIGTIARPGEEARAIRSGMKRVVPRLAKAKVPCVFINHAISKVNAMAFQKQSQAAGGHAIKFFASLRAEFIRIGDLKDENDKGVLLGKKIRVVIEKLKGSHLKEYSFETQILNAGGFDYYTQLLEACEKIGIVVGSRGNYSLIDPDSKKVIESFNKDAWREFVDSKGGFDAMYQWWFENAEILGFITKWNKK